MGERHNRPIGLSFNPCRIIALAFLALTLAVTAQARTGDCNAPAASPSATVSLPGPPFMVQPSKDGCWVFVSITGGRGGSPGMAVLKRSDGKVELVRVVPMPSAPTGIRVTHDGKLLIAAAGNSAVFLDVQKMTDGAADAVVGSIAVGRGSIYANMTPDDSLLFVSDEGEAAITVIDLAKARRDGYKPEDVIGKIPAGGLPIALTFSPDGRWLYTTSEFSSPAWKWPNECKPEGMQVSDAVITDAEGAVIVVDVARARTDPEHAVVARVPAGCSPVRMSMSPKGDRIYVTARNNNAVLAFDTKKLVSDGDHALAGIAPVGDAPVPVMVVDHGRKIVAGNSNRFAGGGAGQSLVVLNSAKIKKGMAAVIGTIPAGSFPREMAVSPDGGTLFLTNFGSNSLQVMDVAHLPINTNLPPEIAKNADSIAHRHDHKTVTVDPAVLNRYTGVYQSGDAQALIIATRGSNLTFKLAMDPDPAADATAESDTRFFAGVLEFEFPAVAEGGHADQLTLYRGPQNLIYKRLDDAAGKAVLDSTAAFEKRLKDNTPLPGSEDALRQLIASLQSGKPVDAMLGPRAQQFLPQFQQQASQMGAVKSIQFRGVGPAGPDIYEVDGEKGAWTCRIWMTADGKVDRMIAQSANGDTRFAASAAATGAAAAAAAVEKAAAAVQSDASKAQAASDYRSLQAADAQLAKASADLATAAAANAATFGGPTSPAGAINDIGVQDTTAAANLLAAVTGGGTDKFRAAAANAAAAIKDANTIADAAPSREAAFKATATAEAAAQSAATAAGVGGNASDAAAAVAAAANAAADADGDGNPYAGAVEKAAAAIAHAVSSTIAAQKAMDAPNTPH